jgi:DNA-binding transcriptional LysR family regulator
MDLRQLEYVVAVVDEGGFTKAAAAVHVAQPSLSQSVRSLEAELGVDLFHRTRRGVTLTAAGEALLGPARQALRDAATARAAVAQVAGLDAGHLDLVSLPTLAVDPAAELIGRFRRAHPNVTVRLVEPEDVYAVAAHVRDGSSEIGVAELPLSGDDLVVHPLASQEFVALVPAALDHAVGRGATVSIRTLARQPLVTTPAGTSTRRQLDDAFAAAGLELQVAVETDHREAIGPLVHAGAGIAVLPRPLADASTADVVVREIRPSIVRRIGLVHRPGPLSPAAQRFVALAGAEPARPSSPRPRRRHGAAGT